MKITTVKKQQSGYLLNGFIFVPNDEQNLEFQLIKQWLEKGNIPEPEFTDKELNEQRISSIKLKAGQIINSKYSIYWQLNHPRNDEKFTDDYNWIDNIRFISNKAELEGTLLEDIDWGVHV